MKNPYNSQEIEKKWPRINPFGIKRGKQKYAI